MAKKPATLDDLAYLLQYLTAIELYRAGLSQNAIRSRLGIDINSVSCQRRSNSGPPSVLIAEVKVTHPS